MLLPLGCMTKAESFKAVTQKLEDNLVNYLKFSYKNLKLFLSSIQIYSLKAISFVLVQVSEIRMCMDSFNFYQFTLVSIWGKKGSAEDGWVHLGDIYRKVTSLQTPQYSPRIKEMAKPF